jgi:hypothetical protein
MRHFLMLFALLATALRSRIQGAVTAPDESREWYLLSAWSATPYSWLST